LACVSAAWLEADHRCLVSGQSTLRWVSLDTRR
jgi:hypothetical protein